MMDEQQLLKKEIAIADKHASRMEEALQEIQKMPRLTVQLLDEMSVRDLGLFEIASNRFAKLQDIIAAKIIPTFLKVIEEDAPSQTMIDRLNKLEKLGFIEDAHQLRALRRLRNSLAHDYADDTESLLSDLQDILSSAAWLGTFWKVFKAKIKEKV